MSGKQDKRLRRLARDFAVVMEDSGRRIVARGTAPFRTAVINRPDSLRGIVRAMKKDSRFA